MENTDWYQGIIKYVDALSSDNATPGGGSAAGAVGALGASLALMAIYTTLKLKSTDPAVVPALQNTAGTIKESLEKFKQYTLQDSVAYQKYVDTKKAAKEDASVSLAPVLKEIAVVPVNCALECIKVLKDIGNVESGISKIIISDMYCAQHMLTCALRCCVENMKINLPFVQEHAVKDLLEQTIEQSLKALEAR